MGEDKIAKLYVYDNQGAELGRIVLDVERIIDLYWEAYLRGVRQGNELEGDIMREQTDAPRSEDDVFVERVTEHVGWYKKASDGSMYMKRLKGNTAQ